VDSTIVAVATPPGRGAVGVVRVSGPRALEVLSAFAPRAHLVPRVATLLKLELEGQPLDQALALWFQAPRSFTGEEVVELQTHGSPELLQALVRQASSLPGVRLAQPGEFTRRALLNGRLDLTRAEAVIDLIEARSSAELRSAAARLDGALQHTLDEVWRPLLALSASVEAALDFPDEAEGVEAEVIGQLADARARIDRLEAAARAGGSLRRGRVVVLFGPVNAGKSTLFNSLLGDARALVDDEPGTTRDALEGTLELADMAVTLVDTAGLRSSPGRVEARGIERTRTRLANADLALLLVPPGCSDEDVAEWRREAPAERTVVVRSKVDLDETGTGGLAVSGLRGDGLELLRRELEARLRVESPAGVFANEQHVEALGRASAALRAAAEAVEVSTLEVVAGELTLALGALAELLGLETRTERLDALFARFCIGK
jgi:tRNA modification GTPase